MVFHIYVSLPKGIRCGFLKKHVSPPRQGNAWFFNVSYLILSARCWDRFSIASVFPLIRSFAHGFVSNKKRVVRYLETTWTSLPQPQSTPVPSPPPPLTSQNLCAKSHSINCGGSINGGYPNSWMVYNGKSTPKKWWLSRGTLMYGNPHKYKMIYLYIDHGNILSYTENVQNAQAVFPPLEKPTTYNQSITISLLLL